MDGFSAGYTTYGMFTHTKQQEQLIIQLLIGLDKFQKKVTLKNDQYYSSVMMRVLRPVKDEIVECT